MLVALARDPESAIHEARVAMRKLRSTLALHGAVLDDSAKTLRRELTWLSGVLGPARDAQVVLARVSAGVQRTAPGRTEGAEVVRHFQKRTDLAFHATREALASDRATALVSRLDLARLRPMVNGSPPVDRTQEHLERLLRDLSATEGASDLRLHDLRKSVKRLRYVRGRHDDVDKGLKRVQTVLGEHQDAVVAQAALSELPSSPLVDELHSQERVAAERASHRLDKAVRKLRSAQERGGRPR